MKSIILLLVLLAISNTSFGQYKWKEQAFADDLKILSNKDIVGRLGLSGYKDHIRIYQRVVRGGADFLLIKNIDPATKKLVHCDTISDKGIDFTHDGYLAAKENDIIIGYGELLVFDRITKQISVTKLDSIKFSKVSLVNDSLLLLHIAYNYHPADAIPGLHMALFNYKRMQLVKKRIFPFPGIVMGLLINTWVTANTDHVFAVTPLSGKLFKYDFELNVVDSIKLPIPWPGYMQSLKYEALLDSAFYSEYAKAMNAIFNNLPKHTYSRDMTQKMPDSVQKNCDYIEKIIMLDNRTMLISLYRTKLGPGLRDVYRYDLVAGTITGKAENWNCEIIEKHQKFEDVFPVNITMSEPFMPYFIGNKVYAPSFWKPELYTASDTGVVKKLFLENRREKPVWRLLEYDVDFTK